VKVRLQLTNRPSTTIKAQDSLKEISAMMRTLTASTVSVMAMMKRTSTQLPSIAKTPVLERTRHLPPVTKAFVLVSKDLMSTMRAHLLARMRTHIIMMVYLTQVIRAQTQLTQTLLEANWARILIIRVLTRANKVQTLIIKALRTVTREAVLIKMALVPADMEVVLTTMALVLMKETLNPVTKAHAQSKTMVLEQSKLLFMITRRHLLSTITTNNLLSRKLCLPAG